MSRHRCILAACLIGVLVEAVAFARPGAISAAEIRARVSRSTLTVGESTTLEVVVEGSVAPGIEPEFDLPSGIEVLGSDHTQRSDDGRGTTETVFQYELGPSTPGQYQVGPIRIELDGEIVQAAALHLSVSAAPTRVSGGGTSPVSLAADLSPATPYVGQPILLRVRLVQRAQLAEDPDYTPPATPGFWIERFSDPESYYAQQGSQRVLVTESRARLLPLAQGRATVGPAEAVVTLTSPGPVADPLAWAGGSSRRELRLHSEPLDVMVRPLPPGAPAGFDGAVGTLAVAWSVDRDQTTEDVPVTVHLDVRGIGNLPLLHTPALDGRDFEVFAGAAEDSAGSPGAVTAGRRRFQWTLLPRRIGRLEARAPAFVWFDLAAGAYRSVALPALALEVEPASSAGNENPETYPAVFAAHPLDPDSQPVTPWAWAVAGVALGGAIVSWRASRRVPAGAAERAQQREWLRVVGLSAGPAFWHAADAASEWLEKRGRAVHGMRREIATARYGGTGGDAESARRRLVEELSRAVPPAAPSWPFALGAAALAAAAVVLVLIFGPHPGGSRGRIEARAADAAARAGDLDSARRAWQLLWDRGARGAGLAARLGWAEVRAGHVGPAAAWVLRGEREEPRDRSLSWLAERVREGGGLAGATPVRWPVRRIEWALGALLLGASAGWLWPRRALAVSAALLAIACAAVYPAQGWLAARATRAVLGDVATLEGPDLELSAGQVVTVLRRGGERAQVLAGRDIQGWLPVASLIDVSEHP